MNLLYRFDEEGFYVEPVFSFDVDRFEIPLEQLTPIPPPDLIRAKFVDGQWTEGADEEYLDSIASPLIESPVDVIMEQNALLIMELAETKLSNEFLIGQQTELLRFIADKFDTSPISGNEPDETPSDETPSQPTPDEDSPSDGTPSESDETEQPEHKEPTEPIEEGENG